jgi:Mg2+ and Co2+ transporter CorA
MNSPHASLTSTGFSREVGFGASCGLMVLAGIILYVVFRRKDWL